MFGKGITMNIIKFIIAMKEKEHIYTLRLTEGQVKLLSWACDRMARLIEGQDWTYQELMEAAWEKRCKAATGHIMDKEWEGGWHDMRNDAEDICKQIKKRFWGLDPRAMYGIYYDDSADVLWDIHQVLRHQLWYDSENRAERKWTVDADEPMRIGNEPLAMITREEKK